MANTSIRDELLCRRCKGTQRINGHGGNPEGSTCDECDGIGWNRDIYPPDIELHYTLTSDVAELVRAALEKELGAVRVDYGHMQAETYIHPDKTITVAERYLELQPPHIEEQ